MGINWGSLLTSVLGFIWLAVKAVLVLAAGYLLTGWACKLTKKGLSKGKINVTLHAFILSSLRIVCYVFLIVIVLTMLGIPTNSLLTAIGTAGVAIGLALKDSLSNFASGVLILANAPFKAGDFVDIGGQMGVVMEINLMATKLKTLDNRHIVIPNNNVTTGVVTNFSAENTRRLDMNFSIGYRDDADKAIQLIKDIIADKGDLILREPAEPFVMVTEYGESAVKITMRVWCKSSELWNLNFAFLKEVKAAFDMNGINIPYNQMDVHLIKD